MNIDSLNIYTYSLPFKKPFYVRNTKISSREGFIVQIISDANIEGFGEIAPLPGLNQETLEEAREHIQFLQSRLINLSIPDGVEKLNGKFSEWLDKFNLSSSVRFGMEMSVLNLVANTHNKPLYRLLSNSCKNHLQINGLLQGSIGEVSHQASELITQGFTVLKLKVGGDVEESIQKVKAVGKAIYGKALLHLDANQSWDFDEALAFGKKIGCTLIDYIEEPFKDISRIPEFFRQTDIPVALDESLQKYSFEKVKSIEGVEILILKPTILGGIEKIWQMIQKAKALAIRTVISSSFESSLGVLTLAQLSAASGRNPTAGLDTMKWFENDLLKEKLQINKGSLAIPNNTVQNRHLNFKVLNK